MTQKRILAGLAAAALACAACSDGPGEAARKTSGPTVGASDQLGAFLPSVPRAILAGAETLLVGTRAVEIDPAYLGGKPIPLDLEQAPPDRPETTEIVGGLLIQNTTTGAARVYTAADGLPTMVYPSPHAGWGEQTTSIFDLDWLELDRSFAGAGWTQLFTGAVDESGNWTFHGAPLRRDGAEADAVITQVEAADGKLWVGGDQGLAVVSPETLLAESWIDFGHPVSVFQLSAGPLGTSEESQPAVAVLFGDEGAAAPNGIAVVRTDGTVTLLETPADAQPTAILLAGGVYVGGITAAKEGAIYAWSDAGDGNLALAKVAGAADLVTPGRLHSVVPSLLRVDRKNGSLLVGGQVVILDGGGPGGGLVTLRPSEGKLERAMDVMLKQDPIYATLPWGIDAVTSDENGDLYFAGRQLCDERHQRQLPVMKLERWSDTEMRLVKPWISGVRSIAFDPVRHDTWIGFRDEAPTCGGLTFSEGLCRLRENGACEITVPVVNASHDAFPPMPAVTAVAFGPVEEQRLALATIDAGLFLEQGDATSGINVSDYGTNLRNTAAAWSEDGGLWVASVGDYEPTASQTVNQRSPHGLGYFEFDGAGLPTVGLRYVRRASDQRPDDDVPGLPSDAVHDVLPLPGHGRALAALGVDRLRADSDHVPGAPAERAGVGGIALIDGRTVASIAAPKGVAWSDVVALARFGDGAIYALDASEGLFTVDVAGKKARLFAKAPWAGNGTDPAERGLSLAVDGAGHLAVGTTRGLYLFDEKGGVTTAFHDDGPNFVWSVEFESNGVVYAGTDRGLRRLALGDAQLPARGPAAMESRWIYVVDPLQIPVGAACNTDLQCPDGSVCAGSEVDGVLQWLCTGTTECTARPGGVDCSCNPQKADSCITGLSCVEGDGGGVCAEPPPPDCGGAVGCSCNDATPCAEGLVCSALNVCIETPADLCMLDCSCAGEGSTADHCLAGQECRTEWNGKSQCYEVPCESTCSCSGAGYNEQGCPEGQECVSDMNGNPTCGGGPVGPPGPHG